jgi:phosphatidylinositol phospholipase C delta
MTHPLNDYYCYSSHNTYLDGNQLNSRSSLERYVEDLENGVRCVEIDVHNDFTNIKVKHGYTLTSKIRFEDVVRTLARFSDANKNHLPIMLSI